MHGRLRGNVLDYQVLVIFMDDLGGDRFGDDFFEKRLRHLGPLAARGKSRAGVACGFGSGSLLSKLRVFHSILVVSPPRSRAKSAARHRAGLLPRAANGRGWWAPLNGSAAK